MHLLSYNYANDVLTRKQHIKGGLHEHIHWPKWAYKLHNKRPIYAQESTQKVLKTGKNSAQNTLVLLHKFITIINALL
jgi:hypothetical protein